MFQKAHSHGGNRPLEFSSVVTFTFFFSRGSALGKVRAAIIVGSLYCGPSREKAYSFLHI